MISLQWRSPRFPKHLVSTSGSHFHFSGAPGALRQSFHLLSGHRFKSFLSTREESRAQGGQSLACHQRIPVSPAAVHQAVSKYNEGAYAGLELSPCHVPPTPHPLLRLGLGLQGGGLELTVPRAAFTNGAAAHLHVPVQADCREEQALHVLKRDGTLLFVVLIKNAQGFLLKSRRTHRGPLVIPPLSSVEKENIGFHLPVLPEAPFVWLNQLFLNLFKILIPYPQSLLTIIFLLVTPPHIQF